MCVCMYVCMYHVCVCIYIYIYRYETSHRLWISLCVCVCVCVCVTMCLCMSTHFYYGSKSHGVEACVLCVFYCVYKHCTYIRIYTHTYTCISVAYTSVNCGFSLNKNEAIHNVTRSFKACSLVVTVKVKVTVTVKVKVTVTVTVMITVTIQINLFLQPTDARPWHEDTSCS